METLKGIAKARVQIDMNLWLFWVCVQTGIILGALINRAIFG